MILVAGGTGSISLETIGTPRTTDHPVSSLPGA